MSLVVVKKIKNIFKEKGFRTSESAVKAINAELEKVCFKICDQAARQAEADRVKTIKGTHVPNMDPLLNPVSTSDQL